MKFMNIFLINIIITIFFAGLAFGDPVETRSSPNYLIILVHGINGGGWGFRGKGENGSDVSGIPGDRQGFGDVLGYLRNDLGLDGYVYYYTFSERDGSIALEGRELGDPDHNNAAVSGSIIHHKLLNNDDCRPGDKLYPYLGWDQEKPVPIEIGEDGKGNCWLEQARQDFKKWYAKEILKRPGEIHLVSEEVIPKKYILITHSLGGAAARSYLSSDYYRGDVAALITISSQHLGADSALALKRVYEYYKDETYLSDFKIMLGLTLFSLIAGQDDLACYTMPCATMILGMHAFVDNMAVKYWLGWYPDQPAVQDIDSDGSFMRELNARPFVNTNEAFKVRMISAHGIPTPSRKLPSVNRLAVGLEAIETFITANDFTSNILASRAVAAALSIFLGAITNQSGDIYSKYKSQIGEGIGGLNASNIDYKYCGGYDFGKELSETQAVIIQSLLALQAIDCLPVPLDSATKGVLKFSVLCPYLLSKTGVIVDEVWNKHLFGHGLILRKAYEEKLIDRALDGIIPIGGRASAVYRAGINASSINSPTASYSEPEQAFVLLSDLDNNKSTTGVYHTVTIEAVSEVNKNTGIYFPIEFNGKKKWVSAITVKDVPTAIKGVINTFLPKKLRQFQYSENFATWKDVGAVDRWGNFTIKDLKLGEGQNVIAFRAESWTGNKSNQHLKIILNTIPCFPSNFQPMDSSYTNNPRPEIGVDFKKSKYAGSGGGFKILNCTLDGIAVDPKLTVGGDTYSEWIKIKYIPDAPLPDGEHQVAVQLQSDVGISQALWPFYVDTVPPNLNISPLKPVSFLN